MRGLICGAALLAACSPDFYECASDTDCLRYGANLFCYDQLCVNNPPIGGADDPAPDPAEPRPTPEAPLPVGCGALPATGLDIEPVAPDQWRITGETGGTRLVTHSCGGLGEEGVFRVTLEAPGVYTFVSLPESTFRPVLAVRDDCLDPSSERACAAPGASGPTLMQVETETPGESIQLVVDGPDAGGSFALFATRTDAHAAPTLDSAAVWGAAAQSTLRVVGADPDGDAAAAELTWLTPEETPIGEPMQIDLRPSLAGSQMFTARGVGPGQPAEATRAAVRVLDRQGLASEPIILDVQPLAEQPVRTPCDPASTAERCVVGATCPEIGAPVCRPAIAPAITGARASIDGSTAVFEVTVSDPDGDPVGVLWTPLDGLGEALQAPASLPIFEPWTDADEQTVRARLLRPAQAEGFRVWAVDRAGETGLPVEGRFEQPSQGRFGEPCDPLGLTAQCLPEHYCRDRDEPTCWPARPPTAETVQAWFNADEGTFGLFVHGSSAEGIPGVEFGGTLHLFHRVEQAGTRALGWGAWRAARAPAQVRLVSGQGTYGEPIPIAAMAPPVAPAGGGCDPLAALARCPAGSRCADPNNERLFRCVSGGE